MCRGRGGGEATRDKRRMGQIRVDDVDGERQRARGDIGRHEREVPPPPGIKTPYPTSKNPGDFAAP